MNFKALAAQEPLAPELLIPQETPSKTTVLERAPLAVHPLFPSQQVFLWLPGLRSSELPFCSCNEAPVVTVADDDISNDALHDNDGNLCSPPYPVSHRTFVSWHTHVTPPVPFHPVPIKRFLSIAEMEYLARNILEVSGRELSGNDHLLSILRNEYKSYILYFLARMGVLQCITPHQK